MIFHHPFRITERCTAKYSKMIPLSLEYALGLSSFHWFFTLREKLAADAAYGTITTSGRAMLAAEVDNLQVHFVPGFAGEQTFQIRLGLHDVLPLPAPPSESMDVSIN